MMSEVAVLDHDAVEPARYDRPAAPFVVGAIILSVLLASAISLDVVRAGYNLKGDEATYVAMALSAAYDRDLAFGRRDLERFYGIYKGGPEGIFLKRGKQFRVRLRPSPPFVFVFNNTVEERQDRVFFGKAYAYSVAAAPFVWLLGMNGFLVFHALLLFTAGVCGYKFLAVRSSSLAAMTFTLAFLGISVVPVYAVFLTSDLFNFTLVFVAYFLWLYKEVAEPKVGVLSGARSDLLAAILLGIVTYSKPWHAPMVAPLVLLAWWRRDWRRGLAVGVVSVAAASVLFLATALISGEFNYQGGERKTFYSEPDDPNAARPATAGFVFGSQNGAWDWDVRGSATGRDDANVDNVLSPGEVLRLFPTNVKYFLFGRHFGFVPYFFPGALAILAWLMSRDRSEAWRIAAFLGVVAATLVVLVLVPYTWSGGGGPPGNRYFLSFYPGLFFVMPGFSAPLMGVLAWIGGALFTAKMVVNPFYTAKYTWETTERGWARRLPVELTMANDLPVRLDTSVRARVLYGQDPWMFLYFLDRHAYPPEPDGMWIGGDGRADIIVRTTVPLHHFSVSAFSPIRTTLTMSAGGDESVVQIVPNTRVNFDVPAGGGVHGLTDWVYLLSAQSSEGFTPRLQDPSLKDNRNLGVQIQVQAVAQ
jgi:hypothetical protein